MHKCPNCGQEFEGKFCPECGAQWQKEKTCPKCGAKISGSSRFCNECGYSFTGAANADATPKPSKIKQKLSTVGAWIKSHLKIVIPVTAGLLVLIILLSLIPTFIAMKTNGTYFSSRRGELDDNTYLSLKSGKWTDEDGGNGTYKIDGENIVFYIEFFGSTEVLANGTISNGVITLQEGISTDIYVKKNHKHKYGEWETVHEANCTTDGLNIRTCACGFTERDEIPRWGHSGEWIVTKEATCTEEGSKTRNCTVCGKDVTEVIEKLPHSYSIDYKFDKNNHWKECTACGDKTDFNEHDSKDNCTICGYPFTYSFNSNKNGYTVTGISPSYTKTVLNILSTINNLPVTSIGNQAFVNCSSLTSITIPDSVTSIGSSAFFGCSSLTSITIPDSVTYIGNYAFVNCSSLVSITVAENNPNYKSINNSLLTKDGATLLLGCKNSIIPDSVTSIGELAFQSCTSLTSITIPDSVTSIGNYAFRGCTSLTSITFEGTVTQWNAIEKDDNWTHTGNYTVHCTDGEIAKDGTVTMY